MANWVAAHRGIAPPGYQKKKEAKRLLRGKPSERIDPILRRLYELLMGEPAPGSKRK